jgi:hypothetical protein
MKCQRLGSARASRVEIGALADLIRYAIRLGEPCVEAQLARAPVATREARALPNFPNASRRLTGREILSWLGRIAVAAARAGAKQDALRISMDQQPGHEIRFTSQGRCELLRCLYHLVYVVLKHG